jgi:hypothetical protein
LLGQTDRLLFIALVEYGVVGVEAYWVELVWGDAYWVAFLGGVWGGAYWVEFGVELTGWSLGWSLLDGVWFTGWI